MMFRRIGLSAEKPIPLNTRYPSYKPDSFGCKGAYASFGYTVWRLLFAVDVCENENVLYVFSLLAPIKTAAAKATVFVNSVRFRVVKVLSLLIAYDGSRTPVRTSNIIKLMPLWLVITGRPFFMVPVDFIELTDSIGFIAPSRYTLLYVSTGRYNRRTKWWGSSFRG